MGSKVSLASSSITGVPRFIEISSILLNVFASIVGFIDLRLPFSVDLIQIFPYIYGSSIRGHLSEFSMIIALSIETSSWGN